MDQGFLSRVNIFRYIRNEQSQKKTEKLCFYKAEFYCLDFAGKVITNYRFEMQTLSLIQVFSFFLLIVPVPSRLTRVRNLVWRNLNIGVPPLLYLLMLHKEAKKVLILIREDKTVSRPKGVINVVNSTRDNSNISVSIRDVNHVPRFNIEDASSIQENTFTNEAEKSMPCTNEDNKVYTIHLGQEILREYEGS